MRQLKNQILSEIDYLKEWVVHLLRSDWQNTVLAGVEGIEDESILRRFRKTFHEQFRFREIRGSETQWEDSFKLNHSSIDIGMKFLSQRHT